MMQAIAARSPDGLTQRMLPVEGFRQLKLHITHVEMSKQYFALRYLFLEKYREAEFIPPDGEGLFRIGDGDGDVVYAFPAG